MENQKLIAVVPITYFENGVRRGIAPGKPVNGVVPDAELDDLLKMKVVKPEGDGSTKAQEKALHEGSEEFQEARKGFIVRQESLTAGVGSAAIQPPAIPAPKGRGGKPAAK